MTSVPISKNIQKRGALMTKVLTKIVFLLVMITVFFKNDIYDVQANTITDNSEDIISLIESIASEVEVTSI